MRRWIRFDLLTTSLNPVRVTAPPQAALTTPRGGGIDVFSKAG